MKKRILTLALALTLVMALVIPASLALAQTTDVGGDVVQGYTLTDPTAIGLGSMSPSGTPYAANSAGSLTGNNGAGYTVTGIDAKGTNTGYMVSGTDVLGAMLKIGPAASPTNTADTATTFLSTSAGGTDAVPFYVTQLVGFGDTVATGYTITITFTVTPN